MLKNPIFIVAFIILTLVVFLPSFTKMQDKKQKIVEYEQQIKDLREENAQLVEEIRLLEEDPFYLEKVAREKMGIVRQGEVIYRITPEAKK